jgi:hypothetical protein
MTKLKIAHRSYSTPMTQLKIAYRAYSTHAQTFKTKDFMIKTVRKRE